MSRFYPMRAVLGLPAVAWPILSVVLILLAWALPAPRKLAEPPEREAIFREPILVTPAGGKFRFVPFAEHAGVAPLWAINVSVREDFSVGSSMRSLLFYQRQSRWTYALATNRLDYGWQTAKEHPFTLSQEEIDQLRPAIVEELDRRAPYQNLGQQLERLLQEGLQESSSLCLKNAAILIAWIFLAVALVAVGLMFVEPRYSHLWAQPTAQSYHAR